MALDTFVYSTLFLGRVGTKNGASCFYLIHLGPRFSKWEIKILWITKKREDPDENNKRFKGALVYSTLFLGILIWMAQDVCRLNIAFFVSSKVTVVQKCLGNVEACQITLIKGTICIFARAENKIHLYDLTWFEIYGLNNMSRWKSSQQVQQEFFIIELEYNIVYFLQNLRKANYWLFCRYFSCF